MNIIVHNYDIIMSSDHGEPALRLRFSRGGKQEDSALYSAEEINNVIMLWKMGGLLGSFAIGTKLAENAAFRMVDAAA